MKSKVFIHSIAVIMLLIPSVLLLSAWLTTKGNEPLPLFIIFSVASIAIGYFRPYIPMWGRWLSFLVIFVTACIVTEGSDRGLTWMAILICLFSLAIVIRRFAMQTIGNEIVATRSVFRALYDMLDGLYVGFAEGLDENKEKKVFSAMVPVTHASSIMSLSMLFLLLFSTTYESHFEEYGYYVYLGMMVIVPIEYVIRSVRQGNGFWLSLLAALVMFIGGVIAMFACFLIAVFSFLAISTVIEAISNLFRKLFGD